MKLLQARWIIPVEPEDTVLEQHTLVIEQDCIHDLLPSAEATATYPDAEVITLPDHVLIPGLINAHTHAAMSLFRGLADDLPLMQWLNEHIWPAEQRCVDEAFVRDGTRLAIAEMIAAGTTCFNDMYFFPDQTAEVAIEAGMRASIGLILIDFPTAWAKDAQEYFTKGEMVHDKYRHSPLITTAFAPHAPYTVSDEPLTRLGTLAEELDVPIHMHVHETADEVNGELDKHGKRPLTRLHDLGLLSQRLIAVHMTQLDSEEIELAARFNLNVVHCPQSNLKLASGFCPVQQLIEAGINVAIGTDGAASNNDLDMLDETRTAAMLAKAVAENPTAVPAATALRMATLNAAIALGLDHQIGSLVIGKQADVVAIDLARLNTQPLFDAVSQLIYSVNSCQVSDVWIAGQRVLQNHVHTTFNLDVLARDCAAWQQQILRKN